MSRPYRLIAIVMLLVLTGAASSFGFGSKEKSPEQKADDNTRKATSDYNDAVRHIEHAKEIGQKGDSAYAYNYRATSDAKIRREYEKAVENLQDAIKLDPDMKEAHNNLGYCYRKLGKLNESLAAYDKAIALDSNFAQAREYRGETYLALGQIDQARTELEYLKVIKSPYADQLAESIELYQLAEINKSAQSGRK